MYTAILSDFHLNPQKINHQQLSWLQKVYSHPKISQVIINGDLVEMYGFNWGRHHFSTFVKNWFPHLKPIFCQKSTIIISGNHDPHSWYDSRIRKICQKFVSEYLLTINGKKFLILHGHQLTLKTMPTQKLQYLFFDFPAVVAYRLFPKIINRTFGRFFNQQVISQIPHNINYIIGHTHAFTLNPQFRFFNSGANKCGQQQGLILENKTGQIKDIYEIF